MLTISCQEMKDMDSYSIKEIGIPSIVLMENAALKVISHIDSNNINSFTIVCGVGNNGGDGLAIARHLVIKEKNVDLFIIGNLDKGTTDFNINLDILKNLGLKINYINEEIDLNSLKKTLLKNDLTIDAIFGIGLTRKVEGIFREVISLINDYSNNILSVDIPSGLDGDTGEALSVSVKANKTITFHLMKKGLLKGKEYTEEIIVETIGIPEKATKTILKRME
ncbi:NAD(P)H-hydrate epimerase [Tissierella praeacuta]|uniref:NAD(P)H-hydrate epimerase n=1 Tax=Tissierella praeacuta TaxID=43131 RepID=UPI003341542D